MDRDGKKTFQKHLKNLVFALARCYPIRPNNAEEAAELCRVIIGHSLAATVGKLSKSGDDPGQVAREYQRTSACLGPSHDRYRFYLSVKPPALNFEARHASAIVATAVQNRQNVHFDAHGFEHADATLRMLEGVLEQFPKEEGVRWSFGITLPARWKRSLADAAWVVDNGVRPRIVKGDFAAGAAEETDPAQGFLALVDTLAGKVPELALATHDCSLAREAVTHCKKAGAAVELELFFGRPCASMMALSRELQVPLRFYVPYGDTLLIYAIRDLLANPHKLLRRDSYQIFGSPERKLARIIRSP
jgi:proline dehydrogenase